MSKLKLSPGPLLERLEWWDDSTSESARSKRANVTDRAGEFLFYPIEVDTSVTLADLFALISTNPVLLIVFRQDFARELCDEAAKGALPDVGEPHERLEYLELRQKWRLHSHNKSFESVADYDLGGVGGTQIEDLHEYGALMCRKGERVTYSVSLSPLRRLLALPIRVSYKVEFTEADTDSCRYSRPVKDTVTYTYSGITLGQLIHSVLDELSFHGTPEDAEVVLNGLKRQLADIAENPGQGIPHEDVMESLGFAPRTVVFDRVFSRWTEVGAVELDSALHDIEDAQSAQIGLGERFGDRVTLSKEFSALNARELRQAIKKIRTEKQESMEPNEA